MVLNPIWLDWLEEDNNGNLTILKKDTPVDIKKEYEEILKIEKEKQESKVFEKAVKNNKIDEWFNKNK